MDNFTNPTIQSQVPQGQNVLEDPTGPLEFQKQGRHRDQRMRMQDQEFDEDRLLGQNLDLDEDRMRGEGGWRYTYTDDPDEEFINLNYPPGETGQGPPEGKPAPVQKRYEGYS